MSCIEFYVTGTPAPQGSKKGYINQGRVSMVESSKKLKPWRAAVRAAALQRMGGVLVFPRDTSLAITLAFDLPRPKGHYGVKGLRPSAPAYPHVRPDVDKLTRAVLDALTDSGIWYDDSQVVSVVAFKRYADGREPGCSVGIREWGVQ